MNKVTVKIPAEHDRSYLIKFGNNMLGSLWEQINSEFAHEDKFVVTDRNVADAGHLEKLLGVNKVATFVIEPSGEISKNINTVISIVEEMEKVCFGRKSVIVALGGGTVGDIAGFAASIFKRGVGVIQIPTTTVSQADSAIGGKTGVDSSISKNAFGSFWHPAAVFIDVCTLSTLDDREYRAGLVESVKHAIISDADYFEFLEKNIDAILERKLDVLEKTAFFNCKIKASVVEIDPTEKNQRRMLNYGHTIGHAVESASGFELLHGEAVAIGIIAAGLIEKQMRLAATERLARVRKILEKLGVPTSIPKNLTKKTIIDIIKRDKKAVNQWPRFVLIDKIGEVHCENGQWAVKVDRELVEKIIDEMYE